jgi:hypothetical protein
MTPEGQRVWWELKKAMYVAHTVEVESTAAQTHCAFLALVEEQRFAEDRSKCLKALGRHLELEEHHPEVVQLYHYTVEKLFDPVRMPIGKFELRPKMPGAEMRAEVLSWLDKGPCERHPEILSPKNFCPYRLEIDRAYKLCSCCPDCYESCRLDI